MMSTTILKSCSDVSNKISQDRTHSNNKTLSIHFESLNALDNNQTMDDYFL